MPQKIEVKVSVGTYTVFFDRTEGGWGLCYYCKGWAREQCVNVRKIITSEGEIKRKSPQWNELVAKVKKELLHKKAVCSRDNCVGKHFGLIEKNSTGISWDLS